MYECRFKVGDRVRIKTWEKMQLEFDGDDEEIYCNGITFIDAMKPLCGRTATIERIFLLGIECYKIYLKDWSSNNGDTNWSYCDNMLELEERIIPRILDEE